MRIAVDVGFGFTKAMNDKGETIKFPSVACVHIKSGLSGLFASSAEDYIVTLWEDKEEKYYKVGESALSFGASRQWEKEHQKNKNLDVLISTAIATMANDNESVDLAVGLPLSVFTLQKDDMKKRLENQTYTINIGAGKKSIHIKSVFLFPQGAGVYYASMYNIHGELSNPDLKDKQIAVIDIGYRTTDFIYMTKAKVGVVMAQEPYSGSYDMAMNKTHIHIQNKLRTKNIESQLNDIEKSLLWHKGVLPIKGGEIDINNYYKEAEAALSNDIVAQLKRSWGDDENRLYRILVAGGGGNTLFPYMQEQFSIANKIADPEFANVRGYLAAQMLKMKIAS